MNEEQKKLLLEAIQFIGFALTENMPDELETVTAIEKALIDGDYSDLQYLMHEKPND